MRRMIRGINVYITIDTHKFVQFLLEICDGPFPSVLRLDPLQNMFTIPGHPMTVKRKVRDQSDLRVERIPSKRCLRYTH
jgi:hypothetical protein